MENQSTKREHRCRFEPTPAQIKRMKELLNEERRRKMVQKDTQQPWTPPRVRGTVEEPRDE